MADTRGIFSLNNIRQKKMLGEAVPVSDVFIQAAPQTMGGYDTGYFTAGYVSDGRTTIDKIVYSTDTTTATPSADLSTGKFYVTGAASYDAGYTIGGQNLSPAYFSDIEKTTFSNDTTAASPVANMTNPSSYGGTATGTADVAYINSGFVPAVGTNINRLTYSTDSCANIPTGGYLSNARGYASSAGTPSFGFFIGGYGPSSVSSVVDRMTISSETTSRLPSADLPTGGNQLGGESAAGDQDKCYIYGGQTAPTFADISNVQKLTYSAATTVLVPSAENLATSNVAGTSSDSSGYFGGGLTAGGSYVQKLVFSTETTTTLPSGTPGSNLSNTLSFGGAFSSRELPKTISFPVTQFKTGVAQGPNIGYYAGGQPGPGPMSYTEKCDFTTETTSDAAMAYLSAARAYMGSAGNLTHGYFGGGWTPAGDNTITDKLTYATDSLSYTPGANLSVVRRGVAGSGNQNFGYFAVGKSGTPGTSIVDKVTYSSDTTARVPGADTNTPRYYSGGTGNQSIGYIAGGNSPSSYVSSIEKLNYSIETTSNLPSSPMAAAAAYFTGTSNKTNAYFMNGIGPLLIPAASKLEFSTDTISYKASMKSTSSWGSMGSGNSEAGYYGGNAASPNALMQKMDYISETTTALPGANLNNGRYAGAAVGPRQFGTDQQPQPTPTSQTTVGPNKGYFVGGDSATPFPHDVGSSMDRLDYSTDTTTRSTTANMSLYRSGTVVSASITDGYIMAGPYNTTICEKTSFASETTSRLPTADITAGRYSGAGFGNPSAGFVIGGGGGSGATSTGQKLTYSTDTFAAVTSSNSTVPQRYVSAVANHSNAYIMGGGSPYISSIDKLVYSTDTTALLPGVNLSSVTGYTTTASGNTTAGYASGGFSPSATSKTEKLTYATETNARAPGMDLSVPRGQHGGTSSFTDGFFGGGYPLTSVEKMSYASDTNLGVIPGLNLPVDRYNVTGMSARHNNQVGSPVNC